VNRLEQPSKQPHIHSGFFVPLCAFFSADRISAPVALGTRRSAFLSFLLVVAVAIATLTVIPVSAMAEDAEPPTLSGGIIEVKAVHSTRATFRAGIDSNGSATEWEMAYATSKNGPYTSIAGGLTKEEPDGTFRRVDGDIGATGDFEPRHLTPTTTYYLRVQASNAIGSREWTAEFTTLPAGSPEIPIHPCRNREATDEICVDAKTTSAMLETQVESNGAPTEYTLGWSTAKAGPYTTVASGTVSIAEDFAAPEAQLEGLAPETTYFVRVMASNENGTASAEKAFETKSVKPRVALTSSGVGNVTATTARVRGNVFPGTYETTWSYEYAPAVAGHVPPVASPAWIPAPGATGVVTASEAGEEALTAEALLTGLNPGTIYYVRLHATNVNGEDTTSPPQTPDEQAHFETETPGPPDVSTFALHALHDEEVRALGSVDPNTRALNEVQSVTVSGATGGTFALGFGGESTVPIPYNAPAPTVRSALVGLKAIGNQVLTVETEPGRYTVEFQGSLGGIDQPQITADASALTPSGSVSVTTLEDGFSPTVSYHFEYVGQKAFEESEWAGAASTPEFVGSGNVGADLSDLTPGETYRYRLLGKNEQGEVAGPVQALVAPVVPDLEAQPSCENESVRNALSAHLPDCRSYEQITPVDKEGTFDLFKYGTTFGASVLPGEDGDHFMVGTAATHWGSGLGPYFFARSPVAGWRMTAGTPQPEAGINRYTPQLVDSNLTRFAFAAGYNTGGSESSSLEYKVGTAGGPYTTVAVVPRKESGLGWVAASADFSKLILSVEDRKLVEPPTGTKAGADLYEYSAGELRQLNAGIGTCGADMVSGQEGTRVGDRGGEVEGGGGSRPSSANAVSANGARVFFEASPGKNCEAAKHLYMRVNGADLVDLGEFSFVEANSDGSAVLMRHNGLFRYDTSTAMTEPVPDTETLTHFRYSYTVGPIPAWEFGTEHDLATQPHDAFENFQLIRRDNLENTVECASCASPFNPEPRLGVDASGGSNESFTSTSNRVPNTTFASANGDYAFFETPAALVPQDVNAEVPHEVTHGCPNRRPLEDFCERPGGSPSNDVYEWRSAGIDGCSRLIGCLSLITPGLGDTYLVKLLGTAHEGRDVFFYTDSELLPQDNDTSSDIYDARVGGGFPESIRPVECEGDACSHPLPAPNDPTPSSEQFHGAGNEHPKAVGKPKKHPRHHKHNKSHKGHKRVANTDRRVGR
jgi:hypothetical protein